VLNLGQIDEYMLEKLVDSLRCSKLSNGTIANYLSSLNNFLNLCKEEEWIEVNTYWFKGKLKELFNKRKQVEYIPEEIWQQLDENLHHLPEPLQRMVIVIRSTGLRVGELLNLPLDCLRQRGSQWRLRFLTEKYQVVDELPICEELVTVIKEQQEYIKESFDNNYKNLFNSNSIGGNHEYRPVPRH
jgi:integrase/recombinase XerD